MPMLALPAWQKDYGDQLQAAFDKTAATGVDSTATVWGAWVGQNATGIEVFPPFVSLGSFSPTDFAEPGFSPTGTPVDAAIALADSWKAWFEAIKFIPAPPVPPFSAITMVTPSPVGVPVAYAALLAGLIAEMAVVPPDPLTASLLKGIAFGTAFYTACLSGGVQIDGLSLSVPPVPLSLPLIPTL
jgi:hypothetical protein